jgi:hypothetical protein
LTPCTPYLALIAFAGCFELGAVFTAAFSAAPASAPHAVHVVFAAQQSECVCVVEQNARGARRVINTHFCTMVCSLLGISTILPQQKATLAENQAPLARSCCALENANCAPGKRRKN